MPNENIQDIKKTTLVFETLKLFFSLAWRAKPRLFFLQALNIIQRSISPFVNVIFPKLLIDELMGEQSIGTIIALTALTIGLNFLFVNISNTIYHTTDKYRDYLDRKFAELKVQKCMEMDFQHTEDPKLLDQLSKAEEGISWYSGGPVGLLYCVSNIISSVLTLIGSAALFLMGYSVLIIMLAVSIAIIAILNSKINAINVRNFKKLAKRNRAFGYVLFQLSNISYGKDIRLYGADGMMLEKGRDYIDKLGGAWRDQSEEVFKVTRWTVIVGAIRDGFVYFLLGFAAIRKIITIGDFTMYTGLTYTFNSSVESIIFNIQDIYKRCCYGYEFVKFMNYPNALQRGSIKIEPRKQHEIEFRNVYFRYPRTETDVLKDVSIKIRAGEHLSVVGLNGAGKTTFIKLLCRLYDVTEGQILLDDIDIRDYDYNDYISLISVVFQDFKLFAFTARENITLGTEADDEKLKEIIKLSGLTETIEKLDKGLDTYVNKAFEEEGTELSGGQQQKLAIARALYKNSPIVILDEPTAALDPMAEFEIYRQFNELVGGKTAIYISHRLSSCKFCDNIAVFSDNTIKEYGTHDELVKLDGGVYSDMFKAQSVYYITA